jgi:hypothetical protein
MIQSGTLNRLSIIGFLNSYRCLRSSIYYWRPACLIAMVQSITKHW